MRTLVLAALFAVVWSSMPTPPPTPSPTTPAPNAPTTLAPNAPTSLAPTSSPTLATAMPTSATPTLATASPTSATPTLATASPTSATPTMATASPTSATPTLATASPTSATPTLATASPTSATPTLATAIPTSSRPTPSPTTPQPTTVEPTSATPTTSEPTTPAPTASPTHAPTNAPTPAPTTTPTSSSPTSNAPTREPTSRSPTPAPTATPTPAPTEPYPQYQVVARIALPTTTTDTPAWRANLTADILDALTLNFGAVLVTSVRDDGDGGSIITILLPSTEAQTAFTNQLTTAGSPLRVAVGAALDSTYEEPIGTKPDKKVKNSLITGVVIVAIVLPILVCIASFMCLQSKGRRGPSNDNLAGGTELVSTLQAAANDNEPVVEQKNADPQGDLPPGWTYIENGGEPYYWHAETEESSWERPGGPPAGAAPAAEPAAAAVPADP